MSCMYLQHRNKIIALVLGCVSYKNSSVYGVGCPVVSRDELNYCVQLQIV